MHYIMYREKVACCFSVWTDRHVKLKDLPPFLYVWNLVIWADGLVQSAFLFCNIQNCRGQSWLLNIFSVHGSSICFHPWYDGKKVDGWWGMINTGLIKVRTLKFKQVHFCCCWSPWVELLLLLSLPCSLVPSSQHFRQPFVYDLPFNLMNGENCRQ